MAKVPNTKQYDDAYTAFKKSLNSFINRLISKLDSLTTKTKTFSSTVLNLSDNTIHQYNGQSGVSELKINFPKGNFVSTILFSTAKEGEINITFTDSRATYLGYNEIRFSNSENWELNIQNGRIVGSQIFKRK